MGTKRRNLGIIYVIALMAALTPYASVHAARSKQAKKTVRKPKVAIQRVAVIPFSGPTAKSVEPVVGKALRARGYDPIPSSELTASAKREGANLNKLQPAQGVGIAGEVQASAFIQGRVSHSRRKWQFRATVRNGADYEVLGDERWSAKNLGALRSAVAGDFWKRMGEAIQSSTAPQVGTTSRPVAVQPSRDLAATTPTNQSAKKIPASTSTKASPDSEPPAERSEVAWPDEAGQTTQPTAAEAAPPAESADDGRSETPRGLKFDIELLASAFSRSLTYSGVSAGALPNYTYRVGPQASAALEIYPMAFFTSGLASRLGLSVRYTRGFLLETDGGFETEAQALALGVRYRLTFNRLEISPAVLYGLHTFKVSDTATAASNVPGVEYSYISPAIFARWALTDRFAVLGSAAFRIVMGAGELKSAAYFPEASIWGLDGSLGLAYAISGPFEARLRVAATFYSISPNAQAGAARAADSATDIYLEGFLGVGYRFDDSK